MNGKPSISELVSILESENSLLRSSLMPSDDPLAYRLQKEENQRRDQARLLSITMNNSWFRKTYRSWSARSNAAMQFLKEALVVLVVGMVAGAGCVSETANNSAPVSPSVSTNSSPVLTDAIATRQAADNNGTIWPGIYMGFLPDGRQIQFGFNTNDHRVYWDTENWEFNAADWTVK